MDYFRPKTKLKKILIIAFLTSQWRQYPWAKESL